MRVPVVILGIIFSAGVASAAVDAKRLSSACMKLDNGTIEKCNCMSASFLDKLSEKENTYALALLSLDESLLVSYNGSFDDKTTPMVKEKIIPLMIECNL